MTKLKIKEGDLGEAYFNSPELSVLYEIRRKLFDLNTLQDALDLIQSKIINIEEKISDE